jgi:hypothetical protein
MMQIRKEKKRKGKYIGQEIIFEINWKMMSNGWEGHWTIRILEMLEIISGHIWKKLNSFKWQD